jgi:hypothetical protein
MMQVRPGRVGTQQDAAVVFGTIVDGLRSGQEMVRALRPELTFEDVPAPRTLAPFAAAVGVCVREGDDEIASGRFIVLYDPAGQEGWDGPLRVIVYIRADLEPEITVDPLLGEVAWSWLTEALDSRGIQYTAASGTVSRVLTEGFGGKLGEQPVSGMEVRASWSPATGGAPIGGPHRAGPSAEISAGAAGLPAAEHPLPVLAGHLAAWCAAMCSASGLPPLAAGVTALRPHGRRRGS